MDAAVIAERSARSWRPVGSDAVEPIDTSDDQPLLGLVLLAQFHGIATNEAQLRHDAGCGSEPFDEPALVLAARKLGLKARVIRQPSERMDRIALPALALKDDGSAFVVAKVDGERILIQDLALQRPCVLSKEEFAARYDGRLLTVASRASMVAELAKFDFSWFIPAVVKYRKLLLEVLVVSFFLQLFALVTQDIGFVRPGQRATIKVESFPYTRYGYIDGTVESVSHDAVQDEKLGLVYRARLKMEATTLLVDGVAVHLTSGMALTAEIKTGRRRVISYILDPLQWGTDESMRER